MNVSSAQAAALQAVQSTQQTQSAKTSLQMLLLKKSLELQQQEGDVLQKMTEGKGTIIDLRV